MPLTNPPFLPEKDQPAYHLRDSTPEELEQHRRMVSKMEQLRNRPQEGKKDGRTASEIRN
jgi:hypothetical protein